MLVECLLGMEGSAGAQPRTAPGQASSVLGATARALCEPCVGQHQGAKRLVGEWCRPAVNSLGGVQQRHVRHKDRASVSYPSVLYLFYASFQSSCAFLCSSQALCRFAFRAWALDMCSAVLGLQKSAGWWVKVGQFLSTRSDLLPQQYIHHLIKLQDMMPTTPYAVIEKTLQTELGKARVVRTNLVPSAYLTWQSLGRYATRCCRRNVTWETRLR